ncbi:MAG TPA: hypothetical protein VF781_13375 [Solirubrobacteraceae bacterium]
MSPSTIGGLLVPGPEATLWLEDDPPDPDDAELFDVVLDELPQAATTTASNMAVSAPVTRAT